MKDRSRNKNKVITVFGTNLPEDSEGDISVKYLVNQGKFKRGELSRWIPKELNGFLNNIFSTRLPRMGPAACAMTETSAIFD